MTLNQDGTRVDHTAAATLLLQLFMSVVDGTIVNIALPVLTREFMVALPFLFFNALGFSEMMLGFLMTPFPIATIIVAPIAAKFVEKRNPALMAASGMAVYCLGLVSLVCLAPGDRSVADICWRMAICGIGFGMFQTPNNLVMITSTPLSRSGGAGGMQATARLTGQTLGAVVAGFIFSLVAASYSATQICFFLALGFAACAGIFSFGNSRRNGSAGK